MPRGHVKRAFGFTTVFSIYMKERWYRLFRNLRGWFTSLVLAPSPMSKPYCAAREGIYSDSSIVTTTTTIQIAFVLLLSSGANDHPTAQSLYSKYLHCSDPVGILRVKTKQNIPECALRPYPSVAWAFIGETN